MWCERGFSFDPHTLLVAADDVFEATDVPALLLQGPTPVEDSRRRTLAQWTERDQANMTFCSGRYPRLYHLDFEVVASAGDERTLLNRIGKVALLYQRIPILRVLSRVASENLVVPSRSRSEIFALS